MQAECGDGLIWIEEEECDDGEVSALCNENCTLSQCGDGILNLLSGEVCDEGQESILCNVNCTLSQCGDGILNLLSGEVCDDGNTETESCEYNLTECTVCAADCTEQAGTVTYCGDGIVHDQNGEVCDDGNSSSEDGCSATCEIEVGYLCQGTPSVCLPICGDGREVGNEECDDGNTETESCEYNLTECTVCAADCTEQAGIVTYCGDGIIHDQDGEVCDDGNSNSEDGCSATCEVEVGYLCQGTPSICLPICGDGREVGNEECDDGNTETESCEYNLTECTVCAEDCTEQAGIVTYCGDGIIHDQDGEACDDGNSNSEDGCSATCEVEVGYLCQGTPSICLPICGDGREVGNEECDDGNTETESCEYNLTECTVCAEDCTEQPGIVTYCGDGIIHDQNGETCDDGNSNSEDGCSATCEVEVGYLCQGTPSVCLPICGDGREVGNEECDDGNTETESCEYNLTECTVCAADCTEQAGIVTYCGDGIIHDQDGEVCDDGNSNSEDGCSATCEVEVGYLCQGTPSICLPICGDGREVGNEECDDGNTETESCEYNLTECTVCAEDCTEQAGIVTYCGDGIIHDQDGEACDDGNSNSEDGCSATCEVEVGYLCQGTPSICLPICGDGREVGNEECDDGNTETESCEYNLTECTVCAEDCTEQPGSVTYCGDGIIHDQNGEVCDDGNSNNQDGCSATCEVEVGYLCQGSPSVCSPICGDGREVGDEICDDGNTETERCEYGLTECTVCAADCTEQAGEVRYCGDHELQADEGEVCDDGNRIDDDGCLNLCQIARCGDGVRRTDVNEGDPSFEECDDGNENDEDGCLTSCVQARCGDRVVWSGEEECDDGQVSEVCNANCTFSQCGDGILNLLSGELCDEGQETETCNANCTFSQCGDGTLNRSAAESCDDGNTETESCEYGLLECLVCNENCIEQAGEVRYCGDGILQVDDEEVCDDGNANSEDGCSASCEIEVGYICQGSPSICTPICGDGLEVGDEICDDGNTETESCDYGLLECRVCAEDCTEQDGLVTYCGDGLLQEGEGETCDDGNSNSEDGCSASCETEVGYICQGSPSICTPICGDGLEVGNEECDDGNTETESCEYNLLECLVCAEDCTEQDGQITYCGDGILQAGEGEACDDENTNNQDGCSATCEVEEGYLCQGSPSVCTPICGDGRTVGDEICDDGNTITEDCEYGLTECTVCGEDCTFQDGVVLFCGDGVVNGNEACDDLTPNQECEYNEVSCQICNDQCELEDGNPTYCGDGIIQSEFEDCDGTRGCSNECTVPCAPNCPPVDWILVQAGSFNMGGTRTSNTRPIHQVNITYDYEISKTEVRKSMYQACVDANYCTAPVLNDPDCVWNIPNTDDYPINCISWVQMKTFATWMGVDLPSEAEWEFAARGTQNYLYPWASNSSSSANCTRTHMMGANLSGCDTGELSSVDQYVRGYTPSGIADLSGNVSEWVLDAYYRNHNDAPGDGSARCPEEICPDTSLRVRKGGSYTQINVNQRGDLRYSFEQDQGRTTLGGRLVRAPLNP